MRIMADYKFQRMVQGSQEQSQKEIANDPINRLLTIIPHLLLPVCADQK